MTPNQADEHEPWQLAALLDFDWGAQGAEDKYRKKREAERGTMGKRLEKMRQMGMVQDSRKGLTVERAKSRRSR